MRYAKFSMGSHDHTIIHDHATGELMIKHHGYVRMTEYVEVEFTPLPPAVVVEGQLKQLDAAEQELREKFQQKLNELTDARARLLSLTHETQS